MRWVISIPVFCMGAVLFEAQAYQQSEETRPAQTQQPEFSESWSGSTVDSLFVFSNDKSICLNGWMVIQDGKQVFKEFDLLDCDIGVKLDGRGALEPCHVLFRNDTLWVNQLELLAMGENHKIVMFPWKIGAFYLAEEDGSFGYTEGLNENLRYDQQTIESILKEYENAEWRTQQEGWEYVDFVLMPLANKLLIAAISGSEKSEMYFKEFEKKVKPDGAIALWYSIMERILKYAKER